jgi:hypothetical protein
MFVPLLLASLVALEVEPNDPDLATRIPLLLHSFLAADDGQQGAAAIAEARQIFLRRGLPTVAEVGDEAAYEFVVLTCSPGPGEFQARVLADAKRALARRAVPPDAVLYCEASVRREKVKARVQLRLPTHPALRDEIRRLYVTDQAVREAKDLDLAKMAQEDRGHEGPVRAIFEKHGVPTYDMVGIEGASMFVVMVQHQSPELRRQVLPKLKANVMAGQADAADYAMVYDRSAREAGRKQRYGQNLECDAESPALHETPIEHEEDVDARRARIGLLRVALYARMVTESSPALCPGAAAPNPK